MSPQYGELQPTSGWDRFVSLGHPNKFQRVSRLGFATAAKSLNGSQPNFARCLRCLAVSRARTLYMHFRGCCFVTEFATCKMNFASKSCALLYWQSYCTALEYWALAKLFGVEQRAPPIFGRAAITLGIGPHSSWNMFFLTALVTVAAFDEFNSCSLWLQHKLMHRQS